MKFIVNLLIFKNDGRPLKSAHRIIEVKDPTKSLKVEVDKLEDFQRELESKERGMAIQSIVFPLPEVGEEAAFKRGEIKQLHCQRCGKDTQHVFGKEPSKPGGKGFSWECTECNYKVFC